MTIGASLLRGLQRLLRLRRVVANFAFAGHLQVCCVIELHRAHGSALENDRGRWSCLPKRAATEHEHDKKSKRRYVYFGNFHGVP